MPWKTTWDPHTGVEWTYAEPATGIDPGIADESRRMLTGYGLSGGFEYTNKDCMIHSHSATLWHGGETVVHPVKGIRIYTGQDDDPPLAYPTTIIWYLEAEIDDFDRGAVEVDESTMRGYWSSAPLRTRPYKRSVLSHGVRGW